jgi:hypothetical protein
VIGRNALLAYRSSTCRAAGQEFVEHPRVDRRPGQW